MWESDRTLPYESLEAAEAALNRQRLVIQQFVFEKYEPIAIVGVGLNLPGGNRTLDGFDAFLREGRSGIGPLPADRWRHAAADGAIRACAGGFLERIDEFDAPFFNIPPKQAPYIDPAQRLLLETAWEALENANLDPAALRNSDAGVYVGASPLDFLLEVGTLGEAQLNPSLGTGMGAYSMSGRLSYFLGWRGPSLTTDTACASSLTALHLAVEGLRRRECSVALCAAVNTLHDPRSFEILSNAQMLAPDGRCKTFDDSADGYARAEGCGALVLKRLSDALTDGDTILALVRGTAIGQDGESAGLTAPNGVAQERVMRAALAGARLGPSDIQYVEAHGTGTPLGDPIELGSVNAVYGEDRDADGPLLVGSLKSNIGHMEPAAGLGGVIKVVAQLRAGVIFPHLWSRPSGRIPWDVYRLRVPEHCEPWDAPVRRASVNGFGVAGAIGVAVLEEAPREQVPADLVPADPGAERSPDAAQVFTLSAKSAPALRAQAARHLSFLAEHPDTDLVDLCYTRAVGRTHFRHRAASVVTDLSQLRSTLERIAGTDAAPDAAPDVFRKTAFLFAGSGSQHVGMGAALYRRYAVFRGLVDECDGLFGEVLGRSVKDIMLGQAPDAEDAMAETVYTHSTLFTLEYALAKLWLSWGFRPNLVIGHSVGEIAAAAVAGLFSLPDAISFLLSRAALIQSNCPPGGMAAVAAPVDRVAPVLDRWPDLGVAAVNSPRQCVISGGTDSVAEAVDLLRGQDLEVTRLRVTSGFHSPLMAGIGDELACALGEIDFREPTLTIVSNVTGRPAAPKEMSDPEYWVRHLTRTVQFAAGVRSVDERGRHVFLEIGPSSALTTLARACVPEERHRWLSCLHPRDADGATLRRALAGAYQAGLNPAWAEVLADDGGRKITLPSYAFDRRRYRLPLSAAQRTGSAHPLLGPEDARGAQRAVDAASRCFEARISASEPSYLADHTLHGRVLFPATAYLETLLAAQDAMFGDTRRPIEQVRFHAPLFLREQPVRLVTRAVPAPDGSTRVEILSSAGDDAQASEHLHVTALLAVLDNALRGSGAELKALLASTTTPDRTLTGDDVHAAYADYGLDYGPQFSRVREVRQYGEDFAVVELDGGDVALNEFLPPPIADAATHALAALANDGRQYVATHVDRLHVYRKPRAESLRALTRMRRASSDGAGPALWLDILLLDGDDSIMELHGLGFTRLESQSSDTPGAADSSAPGTAVPPDGARLLTLVRRIVAELLSIDEPEAIDPHATFLELGVDSLAAVAFKDRIKTRLSVDPGASAVFEHPTVEQFAHHLDRLLTADRGEAMDTQEADARETDPSEPHDSGLPDRGPYDRTADTLAARAALHARTRPDQPAIICEERALTFRQLHLESNRTAHALIAAGVKQGSRVGYLGKESEHYYDIALGCAKSGAVLVPMNWRLTGPEVEHILRDCAAELLFVERQFVELVETLRPNLTALHTLVVTDSDDHVAGGLLAWKADAPDVDLPQVAGFDDAVAQLYTSGTTGLPKGVVLAQRTFFTFIADARRAGCDWIDWSARDRGLSCFPGLHTSGFGWFMHSFNVGATTVIMRRFLADEAARLIERHAITLVWAAPAMLRMILEERAVTAETFRSLRKVVYSGSPIDRELLLRCMDVLGCELAQGYSSAEAGSFVTCLAPGDHTPDSAVLGSAGRVCPGNRVRIVDESGAPLPPGAVGRVAISSPARFLEYWRQPEATAQAVRGEWLYMGDTGYLDENGYLFLADRVNDTIIVAGQNIYPTEVENALRTHPAVADVAVYGVPDEHWGEAVRAAVVLHPGAEATPRDFLRFLNGRIAGFKVPTGYELIDELPRNPTGKLLRRVLKERHADRAAERPAVPR